MKKPKLDDAVKELTESLKWYNEVIKNRRFLFIDSSLYPYILEITNLDVSEEELMINIEKQIYGEFLNEM